MEELTAADFLLFLRGEVEAAEVGGNWTTWTPWSCIYLQSQSPPRYLVEAERMAFAQTLARTLGAPDVATMKTRMLDRLYRMNRGLGRRSNRLPGTSEIINRIGTIV